MTAMADELDDDFDLDIRIDDLDPAAPDRIHRASQFGSCTLCCPNQSMACTLTCMGDCHTDACPTAGGCTGPACN